MSSIAIVILTHNQREMTLQCLARIFEIEDARPRILLWDNGSCDGTSGAVRKSFPEVLVHDHPTNLGVASGRNAAASMASSRFHPSHLLFLDNDVHIEPGFVQALHQPFTQDDRVGQTQAKLRFMHARHRLNDGGGGQVSFLFWQITPVGYGEIDRGQHDRVKPCISSGGAMMVRRDLFCALGGFDSQFDPFGPEDADFSLRLQKAGFLSLFIPRAIGYHAGSHTFGKGYPESYARHKSRHWFIFMRRHASAAQKLGFFTLGAPFLVVRLLARESRKGNFGALRGVALGVLDAVRRSSVAKKK